MIFTTALSVSICAVISSTACHRQYVSWCGNANRCHQKVITALNSKSSFKAHKRSSSLWSISEATNTAVLSQVACPDRNALTGSSEVLFSLPILLSGAGRGPLYIRPRPERLRDPCEESRHCQGIINTISSSDIQWNTELWAIREWNMCASMCHVLRLRGSDESRTKCRDAVQ